MGNRLKNVVIKSLVTLVLVGLSAWLIVHNWQYRTIYHENYSFGTKDTKKFKHFPRALYNFGLNAWFQNDSDVAARFFRQTVLQDIFYMNAWLKLAQAEIVLGNPDTARSILQFSNRLAKNVYRWKWDQILLAHELGMKEIVLSNINFLIHHRKKVPDAFQVLDTHLKGNVMLEVNVLDTGNLIPFLEWLMRWGRVNDAQIAWNKIISSGIQDENIRLNYIHFLVDRKRIPLAAEIWRSNTGIKGMTNSGFESQMTGRGFDWRYTANSKGKWAIRRSMSEDFSRTHSLKIIFEGKENISFGHLYQIVPVDPLIPYRLTYCWRSKNITTDQGPFVDIYGYDCQGFYFKGSMMLGTNDWQEQSIEFTVPEGCHAVVVRLQRRPSHRFDNKIAGILWLDDFKMEKRKPLTGLNGVKKNLFIMKALRYDFANSTW
ncbi:MAG: hypothetical protein U9N83_17925 [Thermodesulfobacteriota bacterium]|nr:hypothetical protein [Thermodesulfobacteriota bacterium]